MASGAEDGEAAGKASSIMPLDASKADHPVVLFKVPVSSRAVCLARPRASLHLPGALSARHRRCCEISLPSRRSKVRV